MPAKSNASESESEKAGQRTVAICLVIVDNLYHEAIWRHWIEQGGEQGGARAFTARLFIHAKFPDRIKSQWVRERIVRSSLQPEWNSVEVVRALLLLLEEAYKDASCHRFVLGTESCLPVYSLQETATRLFSADESWLRARQDASGRWERAHCFEAVDAALIPQQVGHSS